MHFPALPPLRRLTFILILTCLGFTGCDANFALTTTRTSGADGIEYREADFTDEAQRFAQALLHSNRMIEYVRLNDARRIYAAGSREFVLDQNVASITSLLDEIDESFGPIIEYKPQQWSFTTFSADGYDFVYSSKIVIHEEMETIYHFRYLDDGQYTGYSAFHVWPRNEGESLSTATRNLINENETETFDIIDFVLTGP